MMYGVYDYLYEDWALALDDPIIPIEINSLVSAYYSGVSCDSCLKGNFRGRRYKCLICYDYDLCAACYEAGATNTSHTIEHPMQCILTRSDFGKNPQIQSHTSFSKKTILPITAFICPA